MTSGKNKHRGLLWLAIISQMMCMTTTRSEQKWSEIKRLREMKDDSYYACAFRLSISCALTLSELSFFGPN